MNGRITFKYGKLGEVIENIRTFALPFESQTYTFKMQYKYDSYNRIQKMTYPDGEVVHYDYNRGGMLKKVYGTVKGDFLPQYPSTPHDSLVPLNPHGLGGQASLNSLPPVGDPVPLYDTHTYPYIDSIAYNEFELKSDVFYGNGTHALYAYDSLLRLLLLQSQTRTGDIMQDIVYTYDSVGNITGIANGAGMLPNGLGGTYNSAYTYDDLYRLTSSTGGWQGSQNISYRTTTLYRGNGRIKQKNLAARKLLNGVSDSVNYSHYYHYENTSQPNTLTRYSSSVWDPGSWLGISNEEDSQFGWDAAGNMTESCIGGDRNCRSLCWDEQNRLQGVKDNKWLSYYQYDAAGDRTYKLTGKGELQNINGEWRYFYHLDNATLYVSPYLVATKQGYTKHYYAETERIASRIGGGRLRYLDQPVVGQGKIVEKQSTNKTYAKEVLEECLDAIHSEGQADLHHLYDMINNAHSETDCYWYHPDHLGSSSWITDSAGTAVQHLHYLPWGEDFVDQRTSSFSSIYTFSAKEKDVETGLSYFGSRYYSSDLSVWLSVDPMSDKYPSLSPFVYCANNPVRCVDPNGEEIGDIYNIFGVHIGFDGKLDGKVYLYNTWSSKQLSLTESATLTSSPRADVVNVTEKYGLYNYELNLRATLSMLKKAEAGSTNTPLAYNSWNSGDVFTTHSYTASPKDYQGHPGINPNSKSSAAGAYQFLWRFYTMPDFSPTNQDKAALRLMTTKGYNAAILGNVRSFVEECQERWTSLKEWSIEDLQSTFNAYRAMELHGFSNIATPIGHLCR